MKLTVSQKRGLRRLSELAGSDHRARWWTTIFIGSHTANSLKALEKNGLVEIDRRQSNRFGYRITEAGKAALEGGE